MDNTTTTNTNPNNGLFITSAEKLMEIFNTDMFDSWYNNEFKDYVQKGGDKERDEALRVLKREVL